MSDDTKKATREKGGGYNEGEGDSGGEKGKGGGGLKRRGAKLLPMGMLGGEKSLKASVQTLSIISSEMDLNLGNILSNQEEWDSERTNFPFLTFENKDTEAEYLTVTWPFSLWITYASVVFTILVYLCILVGRIVRFSKNSLNVSEDLLQEDDKDMDSTFMMTSYIVNGLAILILVCLFLYLRALYLKLPASTPYVTMAFNCDFDAKTNALIVCSLIIIACDCVVQFSSRYMGAVAAADEFLMGMIYWTLVILRFPFIYSIILSISYVIISFFIDVFKDCADTSDGIQPCTIAFAAGNVVTYVFILMLCIGGHYHIEKSARKLYIQTKKVRDKSTNIERLSRTTNDILSLNLPTHVLRYFRDEMDNEFRNLTELYDNLTVVFISINGVDFGDSIESGKESVRQLNTLFALFDEVTIDHGLQKLKVTGATKYMIIGGMAETHEELTEDDENDKDGLNGKDTQADNTINAVIEIAKEFFGTKEELEATGSFNCLSKANITVGMNHGQVVAGIVGSTKFLYDAFGDAVNVASRMQTNAPPDSLLVSNVYHANLKKSSCFKMFHNYGARFIKGKGDMQLMCLKLNQQFAGTSIGSISLRTSLSKSSGLGLIKRDSSALFEPSLLFSTIRNREVEMARGSDEYLTDAFEVLLREDEIQNACLQKIHNRNAKIKDKCLAVQYEVENIVYERVWVFQLLLLGFIFTIIVCLGGIFTISNNDVVHISIPILLVSVVVFFILVLREYGVSRKTESGSLLAFSKYLTFLEKQNERPPKEEPGFDFLQFIISPLKSSQGLLKLSSSRPTKMKDNEQECTNEIVLKEENEENDVYSIDSPDARTKALPFENEDSVSSYSKAEKMYYSASGSVSTSRSLSHHTADHVVGGILREKSSSGIRKEKSSSLVGSDEKGASGLRKERSTGALRDGSFRREKSYDQEKGLTNSNSVLSLQTGRCNSTTMVEQTINNPVVINLIPCSMDSLDRIDEQCSQEKQTKPIEKSPTSSTVVNSVQRLGIPKCTAQEMGDPIEANVDLDVESNQDPLQKLSIWDRVRVEYGVHNYSVFVCGLLMMFSSTLVALFLEKYNEGQFTGVETPAAVCGLIYLSLFFNMGYYMLVVQMLTFLVFVRIASTLVLTSFDPSEHILRFLVQLAFALMCLWIYRKKLFYHTFAFLLDREMKKAVSTQEKKERTAKAILLNILPAQIVGELTINPDIEIIEHFDHTALLNTDFVSFTELSSRLSAVEVTTLLNVLFAEFDRLCQVYQCEKLCTIGDAYVAASGVPEARMDALSDEEALSLVACGMFRALKQYNRSRSQFTQGHTDIAIRIGMHCGPAIACMIGGVLNSRYDIVGKIVSETSLFEQYAKVNTIHVSDVFMEKLQNERPDFCTNLAMQKMEFEANLPQGEHKKFTSYYASELAISSIAIL
eukprot:Nk52_evm80s221 gene=Nk52_evmTU80s221